jgi:malto-oligosyltrehalose synthase/4-alpha-glucanotransferase
MLNPIATYRIQFHKDFTLDDLERNLHYLQRLGVTTVYASPIFEAVPGSMHGYDGLDANKINPEIGTQQQMENISWRLKAMGMKWLQDIVPNHMAFDHRNKWLMDVFEKGKRSAYASYLDIIWNNELHDEKIMVPFLGSEVAQVIDNNDLRLHADRGTISIKYYDTYYPVRIESYAALLYRTNDDRLHHAANQIPNFQHEQDIAHFANELYNWKQWLQGILEDEGVSHALQQVIDNINNDKPGLTSIINAQHYRLCHWQESDTHINYRRFFTVNSLICLNIQDEEVMKKHHTLIQSMVHNGIWQGLRIDHIDGLYNPTLYLQKLRAMAGPDTYIVVEKILEPGENLAAHWDIEGNTGYDFLCLVNNLFTYGGSRKPFTDFYDDLVKDDRSIHQQLHDKKAYILYENMGGELSNLHHLLKELQLLGNISVSDEEIKNAIGEFLIQCPVYRYYANNLPLVKEEAKAIKDILQRIRKSKPELAKATDLLEDIFLLKRHATDETYKAKALHFYQRCMQFTGPLMAKGVEDTLMYTYNRFIAHNEVGDSPEAFGIIKEAFHEAMLERQIHWPLSLNAASTHDTKRGEDVRARLNVLSELPGEWIATVKEWQRLNAALKKNNAPDNNDEYLVYQNLVGAYPMPGDDEADFQQRLQDYIEKALREAKTHSNWTTANESYESAAKNFAAELLNKQKPFWKSFQSLQQKIVDFGIINSLSQVILKFMCPGVPDTYHGTELWDLSFVDPDNRRPIDYSKLQNLLNEIVDDEKKPATEFVSALWQQRYSGKIKLWLTNKLLNERKDNAELFEKGSYVPLQVEGTYKNHVLAFARKYQQQSFLVVVPIHLTTLCKSQNKNWNEIDWQDTMIIAQGYHPVKWQNILTQTAAKDESGLNVQELFADLPFAILKSEIINERGAGVLLHITSLPSPFGIGDLGSEARHFADFLVRSKQKYWQLLPLNPTENGQGHSPYSALSSRGGNPLLISPELLAEDGLLDHDQLHRHRQPHEGKVSYAIAEESKAEIFDIAYKNFIEKNIDELQKEFNAFCEAEASWLHDFALYVSLKKHHNGKPWYEWEEQYKLHDEQSLITFAEENAHELGKTKWLQFIFFHQWKNLKLYCNERGIQFIGDMPFYVSYDSSDVWSHRHLFAIDEEGKMTGVAGVPPDLFSDDGQLWGMPVFKWDVMKADGYAWWIERLQKNIELCDMARLDHFRAFYDYWEVPATATSAKKGKWLNGPGSDFFKEVAKAFGKLPFVAEDLGDINDGVLQLRDEFDLPGMKVVQFSFGEDMTRSEHTPHNYSKNFLAYTGTHDNNTIRGWYRELDDKSKERLNQYTGRHLNEDDIPWVMARMVYASVAKIAILPMQDVLGLDEGSRMNVPGSATDNWAWRLLPGQINHAAEHQLREWTTLFNRE